MLNKLLVAIAVAIAVVYFGDPYAPENRGRLPWLPPEIPESALVEMRDTSVAFFEDIELEETYQAVAKNELTQELLVFLGSLRERAWQFILDLSVEDDAILAKVEE